MAKIPRTRFLHLPSATHTHCDPRSHPHTAVHTAPPTHLDRQRHPRTMSLPCGLSYDFLAVYAV